MSLFFKVLLSTEIIVVFSVFIGHIISLFGNKKDRMPLIIYPIMIIITFILQLFVFYLFIPIFNYINTL